ncbi:hypothetical protein SKAU_G00275820 [Synaphobranchus kaupii]|uniref:Uncharacterized protein n=1 Tax=Synaphobranchus kaupii TaxID=118154 RepID=A0A9Q1F177_SYNKA|nr:hypothetical protein SKAU_G00275820 [Synaphobranchus kaupii]
MKNGLSQPPSVITIEKWEIPGEAKIIDSPKICSGKIFRTFKLHETDNGRLTEPLFSCSRPRHLTSRFICSAPILPTRPVCYILSGHHNCPLIRNSA